MTATGSGYMVPRPPLVAPNAAVVAVASTASLVLATHVAKNITNTGSNGTAVLTLVPAATAAGTSWHFYQTVTQITRLLPTTGEAICFHGNTVVTKYLNLPATIGSWNSTATASDITS